jgi:hypothetical protein
MMRLVRAAWSAQASPNASSIICSSFRTQNANSVPKPTSPAAPAIQFGSSTACEGTHHRDIGMRAIKLGVPHHHSQSTSLLVCQAGRMTVAVDNSAKIAKDRAVSHEAEVGLRNWVDAVIVFGQTEI